MKVNDLFEVKAKESFEDVLTAAGFERKGDAFVKNIRGSNAISGGMSAVKDSSGASTRLSSVGTSRAAVTHTVTLDSRGWLHCASGSNKSKFGATTTSLKNELKRLGLSESLTEGMWVIKNKDGKEKRFKDMDSAAAKAWKASSSPQKEPKVKVEKYSNEYWERIEDKDDGTVLPWTPIRDDDNAIAQIEAIVKDEFTFKNIDWNFNSKGGEQKRDGTICAVIYVRVAFKVTPEDDMGVDHIVDESQTIQVGRNPKKPTQIDFLKYGN